MLQGPGKLTQTQNDPHTAPALFNIARSNAANHASDSVSFGGLYTFIKLIHSHVEPVHEEHM